MRKDILQRPFGSLFTTSLGQMVVMVLMSVAWLIAKQRKISLRSLKNFGQSGRKGRKTLAWKPPSIHGSCNSNLPNSVVALCKESGKRLD